MTSPFRADRVTAVAVGTLETWAGWTEPEVNLSRGVSGVRRAVRQGVIVFD
ncbi:hypothetical protein ACFSLT_01735 [Novosphingobium resinovorum]